MELEVWAFILYLALALIAGFAIGFFVARAIIKKQLKDNPPVNEKMIRAMFMQMGRKPSEAQIRAVMKSMNDNK